MSDEIVASYPEATPSLGETAARLGSWGGWLLPVAMAMVLGRQLYEFRDPFSPWADEAGLLLSTDWGATWTDISGCTALHESHSGICPLTLRDGTHICILNTPVNPKNPRDRLDLMISDNGVDWRLGLTLNPAKDGKVANYPQAIQTKDGKLHIVFTYAKQQNRWTWRERVIRHIVLN